MDPTDWQYTHQRMNVAHCGYYSVKDNKQPHTVMSTNEELENHHTPSSHMHNMSYRLNSNNLNPEMVTSSSDPDSEPEELSEIDKELARKMRELKQIQKQILYKKTTIAIKTTTRKREEDLSSKVDRSVRNTLPFMHTGERDVGFSCSQQPSAYSNRSLKERVDGIVQRRRKAWKGTAFSTPTDHLPPPNPVEKTSLSTLNKDDHPLKLRVKALMNRHRNCGLLDSHGEIPVKPQPPSQSPAITVVEKNSAVKGFQRFLSVLNKGVDIEMLNRIVIDDNEHPPPTGQGFLPSSQTPVVKDKSGVCESDSQRLLCGAGQRDRRSRSAERTTGLLNQHISIEACKRNIQCEEKSAQSDEGGERHFVSSRRSRSPPVGEAKKPKLEQHQEDLQNILNTIGFSMDADDMCKLAERTQKRLCGIENETKPTSVSDRPSSSPSRHQHSPGKTSRDRGEQTQSSEYVLNFRRRSKEKGEQRRDYIPQSSIRGLHYTTPFSSLRKGWLNMQLEYIRKETKIEANSHPRNYCWLQKQLAAKERYIFKRLEQNSDLSLSEGQTGPQSAVNTVTKATFQTEENKMAGQKEGQEESQSSIQGQQLEVDCPDDLLECYRRALLPIGIGRDLMSLQKLQGYVRKCIAEAKCHPEWIQKQLEEKKQYILMIINPNTK